MKIAKCGTSTTPASFIVSFRNKDLRVERCLDLKRKNAHHVLACCNNDGSERMPLMVIETAWPPPPFGGIARIELGFNYYANKMTWMTKKHFVW